MPAETKQDLIAVTDAQYAKLCQLIETVDSDAASSKDDDGLTIKDVVAHRAHWIGLFLGWYENGLAGKPVHMPAEGYKWNELKAYNSALHRKHASLSWPDAKHALQENHAILAALLASLSENDLYGAPMKGGNGKWTVGRFAEANGASHYRSAAKYIRARLRDVAAP